MTSVEELNPSPPATFETAYRDDRGRLYRALVLVIGNRDIAIEAIDRSFSKWQSRRSGRRGDPAFDVFSEAYRWSVRRLRKPDRMIQGFRLHAAEAGAADEQLLTHFDDLDHDDRAMLVAVHYLGWDVHRAAAAIGVPTGEELPRVSAAQSRLARNAATTTESLTARLGGALAGRADPLLEPLQRGEAVKSRARWRRIALVGGSAVGAVVLAAGIGFAVTQLDGSSGDPVDGTDPAEGAAPNTVQSIFTAETLQWEKVPVPIQQGEVSSVAYGPAGFVAIAQDWSAGNGQGLTLHSKDGLLWETGPGPTEGPNSWAHQMVLAGGKYVVTGSSFNEFAGTDRPFVAISDDGVEWSTIDLPVESEIEVNGQMMNVHTWVQSVATSGDQVLVMASQNVEFDPQPLIQDAIGELQLDNWGWSDRGIEVYSNNGDLEQVIAWEEVGLDQGFVTLITSGRPLMYSSTDFTEWEAIPIVGVGPNHWVSSMTSVGDAFAAIVYGDFGPSLWTSSDGSEWAQQDAFDPGTTINSLANIGDRVIAVGNIDGAAAAWVSTDLATWSRVEVPFGEGILQQVQVSAAGIAVLGEENARPPGPVEITVDDLTVQVADTGAFTVLDADGNEIAKIPGRDVTYTGENEIELLDPETGELLVVVNQREIDQGWELVWRQFEIERGANGPSYVLLVSETGETWSRIALDESIGAGFYPNGIAIGPESIVLTGWQEGGFVEGFVGDGGRNSVWVGRLP